PTTSAKITVASSKWSAMLLSPLRRRVAISAGRVLRKRFSQCRFSFSILPRYSLSSMRSECLRAQDRRIDGLGQIVVGTDLDALRNLVGVRVGADHDDRNISVVRIALGRFENLVSVQVRHHQIEQDETELFLLDQRDRLVSTGRASDALVAIGFQHQLQRVSVVLIVVDDKDTRDIRCHEHLELFSIADASLSVRKNAPHRSNQPIDFHRFGVQLVAPCGARLLALGGAGVGGESDSGDVASLRIAFEPSCGFPAIDIGHLEVHQDDIGALGSGHFAALLAILRRQPLEIAEQLEPHLEHEDVVVVVFHVKHFGHDAASISLLTGGLLCTNRRMRSTRSAGRNFSFTSTNWTPAFNRSRSLASRSSEVMTMTGMSRQAASFCKAATTAKPSISGIIRSSRITSGLLSSIRLSASR